MLRTALLLGGRIRKAPVMRQRGRTPLLKRHVAVAVEAQRRNETAAERQFLKMITTARANRQRQLRQAIRTTLASRSAEPVVASHDDRYAKNRILAMAELAKVEDEKAHAAVKARKAASAAAAEATLKATVATQTARKRAPHAAAQCAKKKIEREVRRARAKANEEAAAERFFEKLRKLQEKRDARVRALVKKSTINTEAVAAEEKQDKDGASEAEEEATKNSVSVASPPEEAEDVTSAAAATKERKSTHAKLAKPAKAPRPAKKATARKKAPAPPPVAEPPMLPSSPLHDVKDVVAEKAEALGRVTKTDEPPRTTAAPVAAPHPVAAVTPAEPRRSRRPTAPPSATTAVAITTADVAEVHDEFVVQLEKAKDSATAAAPPLPATSSLTKAVPATPVKSWVMPDNSTGLFRL